MSELTGPVIVIDDNTEAAKKFVGEHPISWLAVSERKKTRSTRGAVQ